MVAHHDMAHHTHAPLLHPPPAEIEQRAKEAELTLGVADSTDRMKPDVMR